MSWFEVTAKPNQNYASHFDEIQIFTYAQSDNDILEKTKRYTNKQKCYYLKNLFYKYYLVDFSKSVDGADRLKNLLRSLNLQTSIEDDTIEEMAETAFPGCFEIVSAICAPKCEACRYELPDQKSHMVEGGCLQDFE